MPPKNCWLVVPHSGYESHWLDCPWLPVHLGKKNSQYFRTWKILCLPLQETRKGDGEGRRGRERVLYFLSVRKFRSLFLRKASNNRVISYTTTQLSIELVSLLPEIDRRLFISAPQIFQVFELEVTNICSFQPYILPTIHGKHQDLKSISAQTVSFQILLCLLSLTFPCVIVFLFKLLFYNVSVHFIFKYFCFLYSYHTRNKICAMFDSRL